MIGPTRGHTRHQLLLNTLDSNSPPSAARKAGQSSQTCLAIIVYPLLKPDKVKLKLNKKQQPIVRHFTSLGPISNPMTRGQVHLDVKVVLFRILCITDDYLLPTIIISEHFSTFYNGLTVACKLSFIHSESHSIAQS